MNGPRVWIPAVLPSLAVAGCSMILDFDDLSELPCECLPDYVCLVESNRCVPKRSVDLFKSCNTDARNPDDLCPEGARCVDVGGGHRCLTSCILSSYSTPEAAQRIATECPTGTTCWPVPADPGTGVCAESECTDSPNNCPGDEKCVRANGAGMCFQTCRIFSTPNGCVGDQACHPILASSATACVRAGIIDIHQICDDANPCKKTDSTTIRPLICDRPAGNEGPRRCVAPCMDGAGTRCVGNEACSFSRSMVETEAGPVDLALCWVGG